MNRAASRSGHVLVAALAGVLRLLDARPLSDETVHTARKGIKKARAALRLLRATLAEDIYLTENVALRDAGRYLVPLRDAKSLADTFDTLCDRYREELPRAAYRSLSGHLKAKLLARHRELLRTPDALRNCKQLLADSRARAARWKDDALELDQIPVGLRRIFRAGRNALAVAKRADTPEALHEWRKQVKYLTNALKILDVSGASLKKMAKRANKLADRLGEDHDLSELSRYIRSEKFSMEPEATKKLASLIEFRRGELQKRAYPLGEKIYADKPGRFMRKLEKKYL
jgi:hypothetical protein